MFAITKTERGRQKYVRAVKKVLSETFDVADSDITGQNDAWEIWLEFKQRDFSDLRELVKADVKDVFKARAIAILLVPDLKLAPFVWRDKTSLNTYVGVGRGFALANLSPQLQKFVIALLEINIDVALVPNAGENIRQTLSSYNRYILQALAMLPANDPTAARLFERYQINDPVAYWSMDEASGYSPFYDILRADIPEKWKRLADDKMRAIILEEKLGRAQPRRDYEGAVKCYARHIGMCLYDKPFLYSPVLFASQVDLIIRQSEPIPPHHVPTILMLLAGESHKELRHQLAQYVTFVSRDEWNAFSVHDEGTRSAAITMLNEFGNEDPQLADRLLKMLAEAVERARKSHVATAVQQARADAIMAQMR